MDIEQLEKIGSLVKRMRDTREKAELFCGADVIALRVATKDEVKETTFSNDGLSDAEKTLHREVVEALLTYYRVEYRAIRSQLAELGVTMPYTDDIKIAGVGIGY